MDARAKRLVIYALVTLFIILVFLSLFFDLRDLLIAESPSPYSVQTARGFLSATARW